MSSRNLVWRGYSVEVTSGQYILSGVVVVDVRTDGPMGTDFTVPYSQLEDEAEGREL